MSGAGHNSIGAKQLRSIIDRILRLKDEQDAIGEDVKEIYAEAKSNGYDKTALGNAVTLIRKRRKDPAAFAERESVTELYLATYDGDGTEVADKERAHTHAPDVLATDGITINTHTGDQFNSRTGELISRGNVAVEMPGEITDDIHLAIDLPTTNADLHELLTRDGLMVEDIPDGLRRSA